MVDRKERLMRHGAYYMDFIINRMIDPSSTQPGRLSNSRTKIEIRAGSSEEGGGKRIDPHRIVLPSTGSFRPAPVAISSGYLNRMVIHDGITLHCVYLRLSE